MGILRQSTYTQFIKRNLMNHDEGIQGLKYGKFYSFIYTAGDNEKMVMTPLDEAPIFAPTKILNDGLYGINFVAIPYKHLRKKILEEYNDINTISTTETDRVIKLYNYTKKIQTSTTTNAAFRYYKFRHIKSRIVLISNNDLDSLILRVL